MKFTNITDIERLTPREYRLLVKGHAFRMLDEEESLYIQAWLSREIRAAKQVGKDKRKYVYEDFKQFFDREEREKKILGESSADVQKPKSMLECIVTFRERKGGIENG